MEVLTNLFNTILSILQESGIAAFFVEGGWKNIIMIAVSCLLIYLAIVKQFEPLLLLP